MCLNLARGAATIMRKIVAIISINTVKSSSDARDVAFYTLAVSAYFFADVWLTSAIANFAIANFTKEVGLDVTDRIATVAGQEIAVITLFEPSRTNTIAANRRAARSAAIPVSFDLAFISAPVTVNDVGVITFLVTSHQTIIADGFENIHLT